MKIPNKSSQAILLTVALCMSLTPAFADTIKGGVTKTTVKGQTFLQKHPVVKRTAIGAGVGAGAGALTGLVTKKGTLRGAAIGAAAGSSVGLIKSSKTLNRHPVASKVAQGTAIGLGVGLAASRGHNATKRTLTAGGIGAAVGLGAGFLRDEFK